jgi:hypothetical protein
MASFCTRCGKNLSPNSNFCEYCGAPVSASEQEEKVIGHVLVESREKTKGLLGRVRSRTCNILFSPKKLLFITETEAMNNIALMESDRVYEEASRSGIPFRAFMESYQWNSPPWKHYYSTPMEKLLAENRNNREMETTDIQMAVLRLDEEGDLDELILQPVEGPPLNFNIFMAGGDAAAGFLKQILGSSRVKVEKK